MSDLFDSAVRRRLAEIDKRLERCEVMALDLEARVGSYRRELTDSRTAIRELLEEESIPSPT